MKSGLAALAPAPAPGAPMQAIAFSCTSAAIAIGEDAVAAEIRKSRPDMAVTTPASAAFAAVGLERVTLFTPYAREAASMTAASFARAGVVIDKVAVCGLGSDHEINRVDPVWLADEATRCCAPASDALFLSCTGLPTVTIAASTARVLGKPVLTSNQVLAWRALRLAGVGDALPERGELFARA